MHFIEINEKFSRASTIEKKVDFLSTLKHFDLANFVAQSSQNTRDTLLSRDYDKLWYNRFNKLRVGRNKDFQFRDPSPQTRADFYCGYVFYLSALKKKSSDKERYKAYLRTAITQFNSFHAINERIQMLVNSCDTRDNNDQLNSLKIFLTDHEDQIQEFQTPGFLLLANTYLTLSSLYAEIGHTQQKALYLEKGWKNLHLAKLFYDESEKSIHNAYFGEGIRLSNRYNLSNIADIKELILRHTRDILNADIRDDIEQSARDLLTQLKKNKTEPESLPSIINDENEAGPKVPIGVSEENEAGPSAQVGVSNKIEAKGKADEENDAGGFATPDELEAGGAPGPIKNNKPYRSASKSASSPSPVFFKNKEIESVDTKEPSCDDTGSRLNNK